mgnify:CR=1 FL=1
MAQILEIVRDTELAVMEQSTIPKIGIQISISRFELIQNGFLIWVEFKVLNECFHHPHQLYLIQEAYYYSLRTSSPDYKNLN